MPSPKIVLEIAQCIVDPKSREWEIAHNMTR